MTASTMTAQAGVSRIHPDLCDLYARNYARGTGHWTQIYEGSPPEALREAREAIDRYPGTGRLIEPGSRDIHDRAWYDAERDVLNKLIDNYLRKTIEGDL